MFGVSSCIPLLLEELLQHLEPLVCFALHAQLQISSSSPTTTTTTSSLFSFSSVFSMIHLRQKGRKAGKKGMQVDSRGYRTGEKKGERERTERREKREERREKEERRSSF